jgi:beta-galactosidase
MLQTNTYSRKALISFVMLFSAFCMDGQSILAEEKKIEVTGISHPVISLNGTWKFTMSPPEKFWENSVDFQHWSDILVPGECQMQGFPIRHDQAYVYKKLIEVPADYQGHQVFLDFHGIYSYARVWVNGKFVREHFGGFTRWKCPITEYLNAGEASILTVEIVDRMDDISYGSGYAKHQIGGILRDVELRAFPDQHFRLLHFETDLDEDFINADLKINYALQLDRPAELRVELQDDQGRRIFMIEKELKSREGTLHLPVVAPKKWDAEHPHLYTVLTTLLEEGRETLTQRERIGFREVEVKGNRLLVNGMPVKLRGACRHDIHPTLGRMTTSEYDRMDVQIARESNMNFIRTSHYPPSERFLDYCDQYGIYVEDETAVCFVGSHRTDEYRAYGASQSDPEFTGRYLSQLEEMVQNHRNHPSVIIWSIGNENVFGSNFIQSFQWVKENDPTRPVIYSYPGQVPDTLRNYEILSMHYPSWQGDLDQYDISTKKFAYEKMPVLFDEWAHVACYNNFELKEDPNVRNFWGQSLDSMWSYTFEADGGLGGAIWCMLDETFMLPQDLPGFNQWWGILDKNVIPATYEGPCVGYGEWGIVDTWRRKKPEFWGTKKAYSPTRLLVKQIDHFQADKAISLPVYNRFDHTNFSELKISWKYADQSGELKGIDLDPHRKGSLLIPAKHWEEGEKLHIEFYQNDTMLVDRYSLPLGSRKVHVPVCQPGALEVLEEQERITLSGKGFAMEVNRSTGLLENVCAGRDTLLRSGPYLNLRVPGNALQYSTIAMDDLALDWVCTKTSFTINDGIALIHTEGKYDEVKASFTIRIDENGVMEVEYRAKLNPKKKTIQEAGMKFITGNSFTKLVWDRDPYFTAYPDTHIGRAAGEAKLNHRPEMQYREEPKHSWEEDSRGFYYFGPDKQLPYTNLVRSLKEHINEYTLLTQAKTGLQVFSEGKLACRFDRVDGENTLIINDRWDYNSLLWGNYMLRIPLEKSLQGKAVIALAGLN